MLRSMHVNYQFKIIFDFPRRIAQKSMFASEKKQITTINTNKLKQK